MDFLSFLSKLVESTVWPITVLIIAFRFRERFGKLLEKLEELTLPGGITAKFEQALNDAEKLVQQLPAAQEPENAMVAVPERDPIAIDANPAGVIMENWSRLAAIAKTMMATLHPEMVSTATYRDRDPLMLLERLNIVPSDEVTLLHELADIRNKVAHAKERPTPADARRFEAVVSRLERVWFVRIAASAPRAD